MALSLKAISDNALHCIFVSEQIAEMAYACGFVILAILPVISPTETWIGPAHHRDSICGYSSIS